MKISARLENSEGNHHVILSTNDNAHSIPIPPKSTGFGSSANGGELLFLALATCYCHDIYREAAKRSIKLERVAVDVSGDFGAKGGPAINVTYRVKVHADGAKEDVEALARETDNVTEIQNTLRVGTPVALSSIEVIIV